MNDEIMVSIFCITYNHEKYIRKTLDGFLAQKTSFCYEVLIHDDASTDKTQEIIREYTERYPSIIKPILQEKNQYTQRIPIQKTYNYPRACGKYIAFCEGDDYWCDEKKLQMQFDIMEKNEECSFCVHATQCIDREGELVERVFPKMDMQEGIIDAEKYMHIELVDMPWLFHLTSFFIRRDLYGKYLDESVEFREKFPVGDKPLTLFLLMSGNCYYVDEIMSCYRIDSGGTTSRVYRDKEFAKKYHQGFVEGYESFDMYSHYKFHTDVEYRKKCAIMELFRLNGEYRKMISQEYRPVLKSYNTVKRLKIILGGFFPKWVYSIYLKKEQI